MLLEKRTVLSMSRTAGMTLNRGSGEGQSIKLDAASELLDSVASSAHDYARKLAESTSVVTDTSIDKDGSYFSIEVTTQIAILQPSEYKRLQQHQKDLDSGLRYLLEEYRILGACLTSDLALPEQEIAAIKHQLTAMETTLNAFGVTQEALDDVNRKKSNTAVSDNADVDEDIDGVDYVRPAKKKISGTTRKRKKRPIDDMDPDADEDIDWDV